MLRTARRDRSRGNIERMREGMHTFFRHCEGCGRLVMTLDDGRDAKVRF